MTPDQLPGTDLSTYIPERREKTVCSVRVIIISPDGRFILVRYGDTPWFGLPGGKVKAGEYQPDSNLLTDAAHPTLIREIQEECGFDISPHLAGSFCLGLAEVTAIDNVKRLATHILTPIFICPVPQIRENDLKPGTIVMDIGNHLPGPLFPDARIAITHFKGQRAGYLGPERLIFFQMRPRLGPLWEAPGWYK